MTSFFLENCTKIEQAQVGAKGFTVVLSNLAKLLEPSFDDIQQLNLKNQHRPRFDARTGVRVSAVGQLAGNE